jgi:hypothetical protein
MNAQVAAAVVASTMTIRVFLRILNSEEVDDVAPSKLSSDQLNALFKQLMEKTPVGDNSETGIQHPVIYDGKDQAYIDVSRLKRKLLLLLPPKKHTIALSLSGFLIKPSLRLRYSSI